MSQKKKKRNRSGRRKGSAAIRTAAPRFAVGDAVRVKKGVPDPDYPDLRLGGWAGTVAEIAWTGDAMLYLVFWNQSTLEQLPPAYQQRCDADDFEAESTWLREDDLEPDVGEAVEIDPPTFGARSLGDSVLDSLVAEDELEFPTSRLAAVLAWLLVCLAGALYGGLLGALIGSVASAGIGAGVGGVLLSLLMFLSKDRPGFPVFQLLGGLAIGALAGALLAAMATAYVGTAIGATVGGLLGVAVCRRSRRRQGLAWGAASGGCLGALVGAIYREPVQAGQGAMWSAIVGAALGGGWMLIEFARIWWARRMSAR